MRSDSVARILLVGHNPSSRDLYAWALDDAGRDVLSAEPDNSLVECVGYAAPDVVVIDTGRYPPARIDNLRALRASGIDDTIPVVAVVPGEREVPVVRAVAKVRAAVTDPTDPDRVVRAIEDVLTAPDGRKS